jgi:hypothetical protein
LIGLELKKSISLVYVNNNKRYKLLFSLIHMINPKNVWFLYAQKIYEVLDKNKEEVLKSTKDNLEKRLKKEDLDTKDQLFEISQAFFEEELLESYKNVS